MIGVCLMPYLFLAVLMTVGISPLPVRLTNLAHQPYPTLPYPTLPNNPTLPYLDGNNMQVGLKNVSEAYLFSVLHGEIMVALTAAVKAVIFYLCPKHTSSACFTVRLW